MSVSKFTKEDKELILNLYLNQNLSCVKISERFHVHPDTVYTCFGETKCLEDWINDPRCKVKRTSFRNRLDDGWDFEKALTTPLKNL